MNDINIKIIQYIAIGGSIIFLLFVLELVRKKKIKEQYSILWIILGIVFLVISIWRNLLVIISFSIGIAYPPVAFLLILIMAIFLILIQFSIIITKLSEQNKILTQEIALLRREIKNTK
jgi:hypothetical protein